MGKILLTAVALTFLLHVNVAAADSTSTASPKSKRTALTHSLLWTIVPVAVGVAMMSNKHSDPLGAGVASLGLVLGPGTGHAYAGEMRRFWGGAAIRGLVISSSVLLTAAIVKNSSEDGWQEGLSKFMLALGVVGIGGTVCVVSAIHDIATVSRSVDKYNSSHGFADVRITPTYSVNHRAPGVKLTLSF